MPLLRIIRSAISTGSKSSPIGARQCLKAGSVFSQQQQQRFYAAAPAPADGLKKTPLDKLHIANGAKMVPFAGYSMPVVYANQGVGDSHKFVREKSGLFDVSHMVQHRSVSVYSVLHRLETQLTLSYCSLTGSGALAFLHSITPSDLSTLKPHQSTLSVFLHPVTGGIVDDLIITLENPSSFYIVTNAACKDKDIEYIRTNLESFHASGGEKVTHEVLHGNGLIALQGPLAKDILQEYINLTPARGQLDLSTLYFGFSTYLDIPLGDGNIERLHIARGGYTGEDGFEISISPKNTVAVTQAILDIGAQGDRLKLTGLGARDSLRLEAGMCLYGHDIDDTTTPIEAGLKWLVGKTRVMEGYEPLYSYNLFHGNSAILIPWVSTFNGAETVSRQYGDWKLVERRRVGFTVEGAPAREGAEILEKGSDNIIGTVFLPADPDTAADH